MFSNWVAQKSCCIISKHSRNPKNGLCGIPVFRVMHVTACVVQLIYHCTSMHTSTALCQLRTTRTFRLSLATGTSTAILQCDKHIYFVSKNKANFNMSDTSFV